MNDKTLISWHIEEPFLIFGNNQKSCDPKAGIKIFGPYFPSDQTQSTPSIIKVGIMGDGETIAFTKHWLEICKNSIESRKSNQALFPSFSGFTKDSLFRCEFVTTESMIEIITQKEIDEILKITDVNKRIGYTVDLFKSKISVLASREQRPDVIICALPQIIDEYCGISKRTRGAKRPKFTRLEIEINELKQKGQTFLDNFSDFLIEEKQSIGYDLRRSLKGKAMEFGIPIQIMRHSTLIDKDSLEDEATRAWNFTLALYYKAGGLPWRLAEFDPNTCYIGISFFRDLTVPDQKLRSSLAQVFTTYGEGLVLRGEDVKISDYDKSPHLTENGSKELLKRALDLYKENSKHEPSRIVIHKTSMFNHDEIQGFNFVSADINQLTLVAFGKRNIKFFRDGKYPPLRGTLIQLPDKSLLLYTHGYSHYLKTYPGGSTPQPLEITQIIGNDDPQKIAKEILSLTKMNWNSAKFATSKPITIAFAKEVGKILSELSDKTKVKTSYRFYM